MVVESSFIRLSLAADVLKVAHHGSCTASHQEFIDAVNPQIAVISCGVNNQYGHPHSEILKALCNTKYVLRTD